MYIAFSRVLTLHAIFYIQQISHKLLYKWIKQKTKISNKPSIKINHVTFCHMTGLSKIPDFPTFLVYASCILSDISLHIIKIFLCCLSLLYSDLEEKCIFFSLCAVRHLAGSKSIRGRTKFLFDYRLFLMSYSTYYTNVRIIFFRKDHSNMTIFVIP